MKNVPIQTIICILAIVAVALTAYNTFSQVV